MMRTVVLFALAAVACSSSKSDESGKQQAKAPEAKAPEAKAPPAAKAPEPPKAAPPSSAGTAEIDVTVSGAVSATLKGRGGRCVLVKGAVEGAAQGATFQISSDEVGVAPSLTLSIVVTSPEQWEAPAITLAVGAPKPGRYLANKAKPRPEDKVKVARDATSAEIDVQLEKAGGDETVQVKGTIRCDHPIGR